MTWRCPSCCQTNDDSYFKCVCGYESDFKGQEQSSHQPSPQISDGGGYKVNHKVVSPDEIVLSHNPECSAVGPIWIIGVILSIILAVDGGGWLLFFFGIGCTLVMASILQHQRNEEEKVKLAYNQTQQNINTSQNISNQLHQLLKISTELVQELPGLLINASNFLQNAKIEFDSNAYSPYWDCIEQTTRNLATFNNNIQWIQNNAVQYYNMLTGLNHNFPSFLPERERFPEPEPVIRELNNVVRPGLTNFQFATIWEHRKTQNILIQGFSTLGDAISNMANTISYSISHLQDTISSNNEKMIEQQMMHRESFESYSNNHERLMKDQTKRLEILKKSLNRKTAGDIGDALNIFLFYHILRAQHGVVSTSHIKWGI
ncbi:MAG: hypothetical protein WA140_07080 [Geobacteraceae bacterium]